MPMDTLEPKALYQQVKDHILHHIESGKWPPDTRIPSENELVKTLNVSRMTANRALRELTAAGHLVRVQGVGTYVARPKPLTALFEIKSIDDEIAEHGGTHTCEILLIKKEAAYPELAAAMEIAVGTPVFHSIILHKNNNTPVMLADRFVNPLSAPRYLEQDFTKTTPSKYLLETVPISDVEHIIEAVRPDDLTRKLLKLGPGEPCLVLHRQTWEGERIATHTRMTYPGSRYRIGGRFKPLNTRYDTDLSVTGEATADEPAISRKPI